MYSASNEFHQAVADGAPQMAMLIFADAVFTNEDIDVSRGISFNDYFNLENDIAIGQTLANEISFTLFNDGRYLNTYKFGDFLATIGAQIVVDTYQQTDGVMIRTTNATWTGTDVYPYVRRNGAVVNAQPSFAVVSMLGYNNKVYVFSATGQCVVYNDKTGANITNQEPKLNSFMVNKVKGWKNRSFVYNKSTRRLDIYDSGKKYVYEFVPLGYFTAERPKAPDVISIDMTCYDFMRKFDEDMPDNSELGFSYPVTLATLLQKMCDHVGVTCGSTSFINSKAKITKKLKEFDTATMRDVLKWISEAAAGNARMNRDGKLIIDWIRQTSQSYGPTNYETFDPYWYETKKITKLHNRGSDGSYARELGTGDEAYLIQDNPILKGVN